MYTKDLEEPKYQLLIEKRKNPGIKNLNDTNAFMEYSYTMDDVYNDILMITTQKEKEKL